MVVVASVHPGKLSTHGGVRTRHRDAWTQGSMADIVFTLSIRGNQPLTPNIVFRVFIIIMLLFRSASSCYFIQHHYACRLKMCQVLTMGQEGIFRGINEPLENVNVWKIDALHGCVFGILLY